MSEQIAAAVSAEAAEGGRGFPWRKFGIAAFTVAAILGILFAIHWYYEINLVTALNILKAEIVRIYLLLKGWVLTWLGEALLVLRGWLVIAKGWIAESVAFVAALTWRRGWLLVVDFFRLNFWARVKQSLISVVGFRVLTYRPRRRWLREKRELLACEIKRCWRAIIEHYRKIPLLLRNLSNVPVRDWSAPDSKCQMSNVKCQASNVDQRSVLIHHFLL